MEFVRLIGGVSFINDSKGTNVDSVFWALKAVSTPVILIAGGRDKAGDFSRLDDLIKEKVKKVILIGEAASKIEKAWYNLTVCEIAPGMIEAVKMAYEGAKDGDTIILSPGCASFDMYRNFEERGKDFKNAVMELK
jgi:UDP-N-acetylmuramoylalanine--D-glutamate ligase